MKNLINIYKNNRIIVIGLLLVFFAQILYLMNSTANIPIMDYWKYIVAFTDKSFNGSLSWVDLWSPSFPTEHRSPIQFISMLLNMKLFGYNTLIGVYLGAIFSLGIITYLIVLYKKSNASENNNIKSQIFMLFMAIIIFNPNKWEITTLEFSLQFAMRIILYILIFNLIGMILNNNNTSVKYSFEIGFLISVVVLLFSGSYFIPLLGTVFISFFIKYLIAKKEHKKTLVKPFLIIFGFSLLSSYIYLNNLGSVVSNSSHISIFTIDFWINYFKGILIMLTSSVLHQNLLLNSTILYGIGFIVLLLYIFAVYIFFKKKLYLKSWIPFMLIVYTFLSISIIYYGRGTMFDLIYLSSSRYVYETSMGLVGVVWIISYGVDSLKIHLRRIPIYLGLIVVLVCLGLSIKVENNMSLNRKANFVRAQEIALDVENKTDEELNIFQASPEEVRTGIELMKKYNLGIFKYKK